MPLHTTEPFLAPPELRALAVKVFKALAKARFVKIESLLAFAGPLGLDLEHIVGWVASGLLHRASVERDAVTGEKTSYLAVTPKGAKELNRVETAEVEGVSAARLRRTSQKRLHDVGVGEAALTFLAAGRDHGLDLAVVETDEKRFGTSAVLADPGKPPKRVALQADLFVAYRRDGELAALLVEVDRGTISVAKMAEKYAGYLAWRRDGGPQRNFGLKALRVVTIVPDEHRLEKLHAAALKANDGRQSGFLLFLVESDVSVRDAARLFEPVARRLGDDGMTPLFP
ncbi:MAG: replication-relaxation family protein [Polyangiaceae bacterium]|nr:replication-relaxation family protein [Polyangiaceae bacterium]